MYKETIVELQSFGLKTADNIKNDRKGGAGPADGGTFIIDNTYVNIPMSGKYVDSSPYSIATLEGRYILRKHQKNLMMIDKRVRPSFYDLKTDDGIPYSKIALLHGSDCLASTIFQKCIYWNSKDRCRFCGIELSLKSNKTIKLKTPDQLAEVSRVAFEKGYIKHVLLTVGTFNQSENTLKYIADCTKQIKADTQLPIHVQFMPPGDEDQMWMLKEAGVDTVGIHFESFDEKILSQIAPAKHRLGIKKYTKTWKKAVEIFGKNQVSSFIITGIGELKSSVIDGAEYLSDIGVFPFIVPLRPIPGSMLEDRKPPEAQEMIKIYEKVSRILEKYDLSSQKSKAGCVRCGACSALPLFEN